MATVEELERRIAMLERKLEDRASSLVDFTTVAKTGPAGDRDEVHFAGNPRDSQRPVRRVAPWGVSGRPVVGTLAGLVKAAAGVFGGLMFGVTTDKYGPQDLDEGETAIWNSADGVLIRLWKIGKLTIAAATGQDVVVNGGTKAVARVDDAVQCSCPNDGSGTVTISGSITSGADHFKA